MIEVLKQALDAFEIAAEGGGVNFHAYAEELRQAIAEAEKQEPYAYTYLGIKNDGSQHGPHLCWKPEYMDVMSHSKGAIAVPLYTRPPQRTEQEPVIDKSAAIRIATALGWEPKREWVGLTDVEWMNIVNKDQAWFGQRPDEVAHEVAKLVEAKLKEKNA